MAVTRLETRNTSQNLRRRLGGRAEASFLELRAMTVSGHEDDFQGDALGSLYQSTANGANSVAAAISTGVVNGAILLDAGDANSGRSDLSWGLHYRGDQGAVYTVRLKLNAVSNRKLEVGFTDVISGTDAGAVATKATPTWTADDAVVLCLDTADDTNLTLMGVKATTASSVADFSNTLAADTYYYLQVALLDDTAIGSLYDANGGWLESKTITAAVTATTLLTPWIFVQNRSGTAGNATVDWHRAYQRRTAV